MKQTRWLVTLLPLSWMISSLGLSSTAQIIPDKTLGQHSSRVLPASGRSVFVKGGKRAGKNLFHSFSSFSIGEQQGVYFESSTGISNIISRVSGKSRSLIQGTLGVVGDANLIFLNQNGIIFEKDSTLDVKNSFIASTANQLLFEQGRFLSNGESPQNLLDTDPIALAFNRNVNSPIIIQSNRKVGLRRNFDPSLDNVREFERVGLRVNNGKSLLLVGGDVSLHGSGLNAFSGNVEIGSIARSGRVGFSLNNKGHKLFFPQRYIGGTVEFAENSIIDVSGERPGLSAGTVQIASGDITLSGSEILSEANSDRDGGALRFRALGEIQMLSKDAKISKISTLTVGQGRGGSITIDASRFFARDASILNTTSFGKGHGGKIQINTNELFHITGSDAEGNRTGLISNTSGQGDAGDIEVEVFNGNLLISKGADISSDSNWPATGAGGSIKLTASELIALRGRPPFNLDGRGVGATTDSQGKAGNIEVDARRVLIADGSVIAANTFGPKDGGNITIRGYDWVKLENGFIIRDKDGKAVSSRISEIQAASEGKGAGGNINIISKDVELKNLARIVVAALNGAAGGNVTISANNLLVLGGGLSSIRADSTGNPVDGSPRATILLNVSDSIQLGDVSASNDISLISARAIGEANGGNILIINTPTLSASRPGIIGNDLIASAQNNQGGNIIINAQTISGFGPPITQGSESVFGQANEENDIEITGSSPGFVDIDTVTELNQGVVELPEVVIDPTSLVAQNPCSRGANSEFTLSSRGGIPGSVNSSLSTNQSEVGFIESATASSINEDKSSHLSPNEDSISKNNQKSQPAQGWVYDRTGNIKLIAYQNQMSPENIRKSQLSQGCSS